MEPGCSNQLPQALELHLWVLMQQLGHSMITLTMDTEAHVVPERQCQDADMMDGLFGGAAAD